MIWASSPRMLLSTPVFPEVMDGRVKTLHPKIFGGILARRTVNADLEAMETHGIASFDLVVVNLYPFEATIAKEGVTAAEAIEQIDIGGPSLIRAAAKNHAFVAVATSPSQYARIIDQVSTTGGTKFSLRRQLAAECFAETARYDSSIAHYMSQQLESATLLESASEFPASMTIPMQLVTTLRYGENPHQLAALYRLPGKQTGHPRRCRAAEWQGVVI